MTIAAVIALMTIAGPHTEARYTENVQRARQWSREHVKVGQWRCLHRLWEAESHWHVHARTGLAYGIPQAYPGRKMASAERPRRGPRWDSWRHDGLVQVSWGLRYVRGRYGTPCAARRFQVRFGWY